MRVEPDAVTFAELDAQMNNLETQGGFGLAQHLKQMHDEHHYLAALTPDGEPRYRTFEEYCESGRKITVSHGYYLVRAAETRVILLAHQSDHGYRLPISCYTVRPLGKVAEDIQVQAWRLACDDKKDGNLPSYKDVQRAVRALVPRKRTDKTRSLGYRYLDALNGVMARFREATQLREEPEFAVFLEADDHLSRRDRSAAVARLSAISDEVAMHQATFPGLTGVTGVTAVTGEIEDEETEDEEILCPYIPYTPEILVELEARRREWSRRLCPNPSRLVSRIRNRSFVTSSVKGYYSPPTRRCVLHKIV